MDFTTNLKHFDKKNFESAVFLIVQLGNFIYQKPQCWRTDFPSIYETWLENKNKTYTRKFNVL